MSNAVKISASIPAEDMAYLDRRRAVDGIGLSAAIHEAIDAWRLADLQRQYAQSDVEWQASGDAELWDATVGDGLTDENPA
jgi:hypothetical protein